MSSHNDSPWIVTIKISATDPDEPIMDVTYKVRAASRGEAVQLALDLTEFKVPKDVLSMVPPKRVTHFVPDR